MKRSKQKLREIVTEMRRLTYLMSNEENHQQEYNFLRRLKDRVVQQISIEEANEASKLREMVYQEHKSAREDENRRIKAQEEVESRKRLALQRVNNKKTRRGRR